MDQEEGIALLLLIFLLAICYLSPLKFQSGNETKL